MSDLIQDLRLSLRLLLKDPGFSLTAILVLALGIAANAAVFTLVNTLMFKPLAGSERPGQVVGIYSHDHTRPDSYRGFSYPAYADIRDNASSFSQVMAFTLSFVGHRRGRRDAAHVRRHGHAQLLPTLGVDLMAGRTFTEDEERPDSKAAVAIVSYPYWKSHGGDLSMLGKTVTGQLAARSRSSASRRAGSPARRRWWRPRCGCRSARTSWSRTTSCGTRTRRRRSPTVATRR